jgi:hypothetical protein
MLLGQLAILFNSGVVIKTAAHEVSSLAIIFASPTIFVGLVYGLFLDQVAMALGLQEKPVPFL